jgi:SAM-dependent methyltransferase
MPRHENIDAGRDIDWSKTSSDYADHRPGPPESFYRRLEIMGIGTLGQRILDLGTGTGHLARTFAKQGCEVAGVDIAPGQIEAAKRLAREQQVEVDFSVAPAEHTAQPDSSFDAITANQCLLYFDLPEAIAEMRRVLRPGGQIMISHFTPLPRLDSLVAASEKLVLEHNPDWSAADWSGHVPTRPTWSRELFDMPCFFYYDEPIPFTHESWRGRMRTLRGIGATLSPAQVAAFDRDLTNHLKKTNPPNFTVLHRLHIQIFHFKPHPHPKSQ